MKRDLTEQIAMTCHAVHNVHCAENNQHVIPWEEKSDTHRAMVVIVVESILEGLIESPEEAHENFVAFKQAAGWRYGPEFSTQEKTNPRLCNYEALKKEEKAKDLYFFAVVNSYKKR